MKVLLNDGMDKDGIKMFEEAGIEVDAEKRDAEQLVKDIGDFDAISVRSATKVTKEVVEAGAKGSLKIIGRAGVGYDNIDVETANKHGILVKIAPHGNTNQTAELALALMMAAARHIGESHHTLKKGVWKKKPYKGLELSHKTLGVIGCGRIGQRLSELVMGFDMDVIGFDEMPELVKERFPDSRIKMVSKDELLKEADFISIHTGGKNVIIGEKELAMMKPTAILVNASRGGNIDEEALYEALAEKKIAAAGLDTYVGEPKKEEAEFTNKLAKLDNVALTSHLGAQSKEGQKRTSIEMAKVMIDFLKDGDFTNAVNAGETIEAELKPIYSLFIYHRDELGVFAKIDEVLAEHGINIRETQSRQLGKGKEVLTVYLVHQEVSDDAVAELKKLDIVNSVKV